MSIHQNRATGCVRSAGQYSQLTRLAAELCWLFHIVQRAGDGVRYRQCRDSANANARYVDVGTGASRTSTTSWSPMRTWMTAIANFDKGLISNRLDLFSEFDVSYQKVEVPVWRAARYDDVTTRATTTTPPGTINSYSVRYDQFTKDTRDLHGVTRSFAMRSSTPTTISAMKCGGCRAWANTR